MQGIEILDKAIRRIPDFPKKGILFYDITGALMSPEAMRYIVGTAVSIYKDKAIDAVAAVESRGFIFGAPLAERLGIPLILIRKKGKLPGGVYRCAYSLEYGTAEIELHKSDVASGQKILVVDDLIATGGTLGAARKLIEMAGAQVEEYFGVIGLPDLRYEEALSPVPVRTLIQYGGT